MATVTQRGGKKLQKLLREAGKGGAKEVEVGFFSTARYPDGTHVAEVAAYNEFGTGTIPERPFFRRAIAEMEDRLSQIIPAGIDTEQMTVDPNLGDKVGAYAAGQVQESITALREPPNAPETVRRKGSSNPLVDSGFMRGSVSWRVR